MVMSTKSVRKDGTYFTPASFSHVYRLFTAKESNDKGTWYGWEVEKVGPCDNAAAYQEAKAFAQSVAKGDVQVKHQDDAAAKPEVAEDF